MPGSLRLLSQSRSRGGHADRWGRSASPKRGLHTGEAIVGPSGTGLGARSTHLLVGWIAAAAGPSSSGSTFVRHRRRRPDESDLRARADANPPTCDWGVPPPPSHPGPSRKAPRGRRSRRLDLGRKIPHVPGAAKLAAATATGWWVVARRRGRPAGGAAPGVAGLGGFDGRSSFCPHFPRNRCGRSGGLCICRWSAALLLERTTGFEPATPTLASWQKGRS